MTQIFENILLIAAITTVASVTVQQKIETTSIVDQRPSESGQKDTTTIKIPTEIPSSTTPIPIKTTTDYSNEQGSWPANSNRTKTSSEKPDSTEKIATNASSPAKTDSSVTKDPNDRVDKALTASSTVPSTTTEAVKTTTATVSTSSTESSISTEAPNASTAKAAESPGGSPTENSSKAAETSTESTSTESSPSKEKPTV